MEKDLTLELMVIINLYLSLGKDLCNKLKKLCDEGDILVALRQKKISKEGHFFYNGSKVFFTFHGVGCRFESDRFVLDLDFGGGGRCDGFDLWRLKCYINENKRFIDSPFRINENLEKTFRELIEKDKIFCKKNQLSPHLYYLT